MAVVGEKIQEVESVLVSIIALAAEALRDLGHTVKELELG
jgi:hypothetical protein